MVDTTDRSQSFRLAGAVFEGGLVFVALALGLLFHINPFADFRIDRTSVFVGIAAALLPFALLVVSDRFRFSALERMKRIVLQLLGPSLAACRWYELVLVAALAGFGEELVFRGVLQRLLERWLDFGGSGHIAGLIASNVIFGLLHFLTPTYALLAGLMGDLFRRAAGFDQSAQPGRPDGRARTLRLSRIPAPPPSRADRSDSRATVTLTGRPSRTERDLNFAARLCRLVARSKSILHHEDTKAPRTRSSSALHR